MCSVWADIQSRSAGELVRKEDIIPISIKITKKVPYYDWTKYYVQFKNENTKHWVRWNIYFPKAYMKVDDMLPILAENGLDIKNMSNNSWSDFTKGTGSYLSFHNWIIEQKKAAKQDGETEKKRYLDYSYTTKKLCNSAYLVTVTMRMYGQWRKFRYVFDYIPYNWEYEDDETGKTRCTPIYEAIGYDVEGMIAILPHTCLTKEEWGNNDFFKELYEAARDSIKRYNS